MAVDTPAAPKPPDTTSPDKGAPTTAIPGGILERVTRGTSQIKKGTALRNECLAMWRGNQYVHRTKDGYLVSQSTLLGQRPAHRPRTTRNLIHGLVEAKVSAATQRVPGYEINPSTTDPEDISAAALSGKVALFGYEEWSLRRATRRVVTNAIVQDGGYAMPYWDQTIPPYISADGLGMGDVRVRTFSGNEVGWEPGVKFHDSPWHIIVQGRLVEDVMAMPGYLPGERGAPLVPDAASSEILNSETDTAAQNRLVMVTEYLERPCAKYQKGRRLVMANQRLVIPEEPYPCADYGFDDICLHELTWTTDPDSDRDRGLVQHGLDAQRTYNNCTNQQISWAQLALNPQVIGPPLASDIKFTDEPGVYIPVVPINGMVPQWRDVPPIPPELGEMKAEAKQDMWDIFAADEIPPGLHSAAAIQFALDQVKQRWVSFVIDLTEWHANLMRHCLLLVQRYYTEPRLVAIRGRFGWERIEDFRGTDLRNQTDVRVLPGSVESQTRQAIQDKVTWLAQTFPGFVSPEAALAAIDGATGEKLIESYELDVSRANMMLQKILAGPEVLFAEPLTDPSQPPPWAPRDFDNVSVHMHVFADYMKTPDFDQQPPPVQEALRLYYEGCKFLKQQADMQQAIQQTQMAEGLGMANAAKPQTAKPMPSSPTPGGKH